MIEGLEVDAGRVVDATLRIGGDTLDGGDGDDVLTGDDTVVVARITSGLGTTLATIVNYACHPTTLAWENKLLSPDYIGAMRQTVEATTQAPCLFLQGASGELAPAEQYTGDTAVPGKGEILIWQPHASE